MKMGLIALAGAVVLFATRRVTRMYLYRASRAVQGGASRVRKASDAPTEVKDAVRS